MKNVELLLRETVPHLGKVGDIVRVAPGYARNYLEPRRLGVRATPEAIAAMQKKREAYEVQEAAKLAEATERGRRFEPAPIGLYFAKLWYFERLYPLAFTAAALARLA